MESLSTTFYSTVYSLPLQLMALYRNTSFTETATINLWHFITSKYFTTCQEILAGEFLFLAFLFNFSSVWQAHGGTDFNMKPLWLHPAQTHTHHIWPCSKIILPSIRLVLSWMEKGAENLIPDFRNTQIAPSTAIYMKCSNEGFRRISIF